MRVKALQSIYYGKAMRAIGEEYEMDDRESGEAKILAVLGKIEIMPAASAPLQGLSGPTEALEDPNKPDLSSTLRTAALKSEDSQPTHVEPMTSDSDLVPGRRRYTRRDLRAEK